MEKLIIIYLLKDYNQNIKNQKRLDLEWVVEKNIEGANWISRVSGVSKTHAEAKTIVDNQIATDQAAWDADNVDGESADDKVDRLGPTPTAITLPYIPE